METVLVSIEVSPANPTIAIGTNMQFTATGIYSDNSTQDVTTSVFWNSLTPAVATISNTANSNGLATAVSTGSTTITATLSGVSGSTTLAVSNVTLLSINVTPNPASVIVGMTLQFTATGMFSDSTSQDLTKSVTWSSSNTDIATINNSPTNGGLARGVGIGSVTITATLNSVTDTTTLTVN